MTLDDPSMGMVWIHKHILVFGNIFTDFTPRVMYTFQDTELQQTSVFI